MGDKERGVETLGKRKKRSVSRDRGGASRKVRIEMDFSYSQNPLESTYYERDMRRCRIAPP